ncbi:MAG: hypothetical protein WC342_02695 [Methanoregula sp.]|jgi:DNA-binding helix-hairpin-helix protein with protein kinase domain
MSPQKFHNFFDSRSTLVSLGKKVGSGGEGDVYEIAPHRRDVLAKIYHKPLTDEKQEKLRLMVRGCNDDLKEFAAWPLDVLHEGIKGPVCGFIMPRITDCEPIHKVYGPSHRKEAFPKADWKFLVRTAKNLAAAFYIIHKYGYVIGDVNEGNILVTKKACVRLIDCDSFQVQTREKIYHCEVGVAQFTPPELQRSKDFKMLRTANHDNFGLGILVFLLLFMGRHPFSGVFHGKDDMPIERAIAEYRFAFGRSAAMRSMSPPPNSVDLSIVPSDVSGLFEQAFTEQGRQSRGRPSANDWWNVLDSLERRIKICPVEPAHKYYSGLKECPWCRLENTTGVVLFLSADNISKIDISTEWKTIQNIKPPGPAPDISPKHYTFPPKPLDPAIRRSLMFRRARLFAGAVLLAAGVGIVLWLGDSWDCLIGLVPISVALVLFLYPGKESTERKRRQKEYDDAVYNWKLWEKKWVTDVGDAAFNSQLSAMQSLRSRYDGIEREYKRALDSMNSSAKERQKKKFLENCFFDCMSFPRIGENRKAALRSFGIETAADISRPKIMSIPGFDETAIEALVTWRAQMENMFIFDPSKGTSPSDVQGLIHTFQPKIKPVERDLLIGVEKLQSIQQKVFKNRAKFQPLVEKSAKDLAQARANLSVFSLTGKKP